VDPAGEEPMPADRPLATEEIAAAEHG
jgi:hypothetical protein